MEIRKQLVKRNVAGDIILVPVGDASLELKGLITLNETAELLWDALLAAENEQALVEALRESYEVDAGTAAADVDAFLKKLRALQIL